MVVGLKSIGSLTASGYQIRSYMKRLTILIDCLVDLDHSNDSKMDEAAEARYTGLSKRLLLR